MSLDLKKYMSSRYVNAGRDWPLWDCWGMCRAAAKEIHGVGLPRFDGFDAESLIGKTRRYRKMLGVCLVGGTAQHGALAVVVTGDVSTHAGTVIDISGYLYVMDITPESGPRIQKLKEFEELYGHAVQYHTPA